ncbi:hypothetical protein ADN00_06600 [Ornatilinea apprima]|uniref:Carboxypeptidase regulatory-like domain-containing protein n=1 Tax=Ornatilinea apprima TaxID=1134406 RepID=A0A0P6Y9V3_9CHLR|nr:hypothetical protein [Ornatilinea apprima]KPL78585.1 hypothetical protein ADN00_06600 [Ornatilinea apprima]
MALNQKHYFSLAIRILGIVSLVGLLWFSQGERARLAAAAPLLPWQSTLPESVTINGRVTHGGGGELPAEMEVLLVVYEDMTVKMQQVTGVDADGYFEFLEVPVRSGWAYLVSVIHQEVPFYSDLITADDLAFVSEISLPVKIYDSTRDTSGLRAEAVQVSIDFSEPGMLRVAQSYTIANPSALVVLPAEADGAVLTFSLPANAQQVSLADGELGGRFIRAGDQVGDRQAVLHHERQHTVAYAYQVPYTRGYTLELILPVETRSLSVMAPANGVRLKGTGLNDAGTRDAQGQTMRLFTASNLPAGEVVKLEISGRPRDPGDPVSTSSLSIGLAGLALAVIASAVVVSRWTKHEPPAAEGTYLVGNGSDEPVEYWLEQIASLDDLQRSGQIDPAVYEARRAELKSRLHKIRQRDEQ